MSWDDADRPVDTDLDWLSHVRPVGLVVAPQLLQELGLTPIRQTLSDSAEVADQLADEDHSASLRDPWSFCSAVLGWPVEHVAGVPGGPPLPTALSVALPEHDIVLQPNWAVAELSGSGNGWQLLVRVEAAGVDPDRRATMDGWEATPQQRFERLLRDTGVFAGVLITDRELRIVHAPRGETSGYLSFPLRPLATVAGRVMLAGLKLLLDTFRLFSDAEERRLPALLRRSRDAQASVSSALAEQVLGALHELLRGLDRAAPDLVRDLAARSPAHLYEGLLAVLMRLVFVLYAEDRELLPSRTDGRARTLYESGYSVRGLYSSLLHDAALNPDTMDERFGAWGRLLALFRLIHGGHASQILRARGGKLFDPQEYPFLEGRRDAREAPQVLKVGDGCCLRILDGLMTYGSRGERQRLSYRTLDVEQIGSVYEAVMGFTVQLAAGRALAIKAGKNHRTPVFVELDALLARKSGTRVRFLKEQADRGQLSARQAKAVEAATTFDELAAALESVADERGSPQRVPQPAGAPLLQPTGERRRSGSHYTPRSLTGPIVAQALAPALAQLGSDATPQQVLQLKVCDPAMGSGAFLVAACRALGERLVQAWARWPAERPVIPADEDEQLRARRLVAQRCLYGVDRNARAVDLARLSLWLATLARDHEFTFLDHALKCGDSLVGLTRSQIQSFHWDETRGLPMFQGLLRERIELAIRARAEIRDAPDDVAIAVQSARHREAEGELHGVRLVGDALIAAFFSADKPKTRETARQRLESWANASDAELWPRLEQEAARLVAGEHALRPFHWEVEFPEVFARENPGFDAIVGNPPFAGKNSIIAGNADSYLEWLQTLHADAHGNADLVAHFFRRAWSLIRRDGAFGLIATNTIGQGDTRASALTPILRSGGAIARATRRLQWPGEAAVIVSIVHVVKGAVSQPMLDGQPVRRVSAYLVEGDLDITPVALAANAGKAFQGSILLGMGFTFDDVAGAKGTAECLATMQELIRRDPRNAERIFPYIGGEEVNTDPRHAFRRFVIDFADFPLRRGPELPPWSSYSASEKDKARQNGLVPLDYPDSVAADWPDLLDIVERLVKPERATNKDRSRREQWWRHTRRTPALHRAVELLPQVLATNCGASPHLAFAFLPKGVIFAHTLTVFAFASQGAFAALQARTHEIWARFFSSTLEDRLRYLPSDCFRNFPFPESFDSDDRLEAAGRAYHDFRAAIMIRHGEGLTATYNRFHSRGDNAPSIEQLRRLHGEMDAVVLRAYGWEDLAASARAEFVELDSDDNGKPARTRLDWPAPLKDEVLARLLALNSRRAAAERAAGVSLGEDTEGEDSDDD